MLPDFARVLFGLSIALFHVQVADFLRRQDRALAAAFRERGVQFPDALPRALSRNLFFLLGVSIALTSLVRIWISLR